MQYKLHNQGAIFFALLFLAIGIFLAFQRLNTPKPITPDAKIADFSALRSLTHLQQIAKEPHPIGTKEADSVALYIIRQAKKYDFDVFLQDTITKGGNGAYSRTKNLIFIKRGTLGNQSKAVLVAGHYDSVIFGAGAADDGAACAAILECMRALKYTKEILRNDVIFLLTDGEEMGLLGAQSFLLNDTLSNQIGIVLNFEARGAAGQPLLFEMQGNNASLLEAISKTVPDTRGSSLFEEVYKFMPNSTDLTVFKQKIPYGMNFAFLDKHTHYHTALDTPENIDQGAMQVQGNIMLALLRHFGNADLTKFENKQLIFSDFPLLGLIQYEQKYALPLSYSAFGIFWLFFALALFKKQLKPVKILAALCLILAMIGISAAAIYGIWTLIFRTHEAYQWTNYGDIYVSNVYFWSFSAFILGLNGVLSSFIGRHIGVTAKITAFLLVIIPLNIYVSMQFVGASYLTLLLSAISLLIYFYAIIRNEFDYTSSFDAVVLGFFALPLLIIFIPIAYMTQVALTIHSSFIGAAVVALIFWALYPFWHLFHQYKTQTFYYMVLFFSVLTWLYLAMNMKFDEQKKKNNSLFFAYDATTKEGKWASLDKKTDDFTVNFLGENPEKDSLAAFIRFYPRLFLTKKDSSIHPKPSEMKILAIKRDSLNQRVKLLFVSGEAAEFLHLKLPFSAKNIIFKTDSLTFKPQDTTAYRLFAMPKLEISFDLPRETDSIQLEIQEMKFGLKSIWQEKFVGRKANMMPRPILGNHAVWLKSAFSWQLRKEESLINAPKKEVLIKKKPKKGK